MRIKNIKADNFCGHNFDYPIHPVTMIVGNNATGKTAIANAIRVGLVGYHPRLGKQPSSTWLLAGAETKMSVVLETDQTACSHFWERSAKGTVSYEGTLPFTTPIVLLDARDYLNRTSAERINAVCRLCDATGSGYTNEKLISQLEQIEVMPMKVAGPIVQQVVEGCKKTLATQDSPQDKLERLVNQLKAQLKTSQTEAKLISNSMVSTKVKPRVGPAPKDVGSLLSSMRKERDELAGQAQAIKQGVQQQQNKAARLVLLQTELAKLPTDFSEVQVLEYELSKTSEDKSTSDDCRRKVSVLRNELDDNESCLGKINSEIATLRKQKAVALSECPFCHNSAPGWDKQIRDAIDEKLSELLQERGKQQGLWAAISEKLNAAKTIFAKSLAEDEEREKKRKEIQTKLQVVKSDQYKRKKLEAELEGLNAAAVDAGPLPELERKLVEIEGKLSALQSEQMEWEMQQSARSQRDENETKVIAKNAEVDVLKESIQVVIKQQSDLVDVAFNELLGKAKLFTDGILKSPMVYYEGNLGRFEGDTFVTWETFSGTEEAIGFAGLSVALAQSAPIKVVIMDELGRLTVDNKIKLLARMIELTKSGHIDNFIGIDVETVRDLSNEVNVIHT